MAPARLLDRNVRPRHDDDDESVHDASHSQYTSEDDLDDESEDGHGSAPEAAGPLKRIDGESEDEAERDTEHDIGNVSFGALLEAQDTLSRKRKRGSQSLTEQDAKLVAVRARLDEIRSQKAKTSEDSDIRTRQEQVSGENPLLGEQEADGDQDEESDSGPSEEGAPLKCRTSKHAPRNQSSRYQVTRKRNVVDVPKRVVRDPRFDAIQQRSAHSGNSDKAYSFLRDYQKDEIAELKTAIKQARNEDDQQTLRRKMVSMENQIKSKEAKEREQDVVNNHRREERERVEQGKKPFYLKEKDIKARAMVEKFKGMKSKDREKLIERRRKKEGQKEKKKMPNARRVAG